MARADAAVTRGRLRHPDPPVTVAQDPDEIVITPDGIRAYVLSYGGTVTPIVTATNSAGQPIVIADALDRGMVLAP
jgi:DNA-binding beta-propeller fold protein YncE